MHLQEAAAVTARKLAHQFPGSPAAYLGLGLTLYQNLLRESTESSTSQQRSLVLHVSFPTIQYVSSSSASWIWHVHALVRFIIVWNVPTSHLAGIVANVCLDLASPTMMRQPMSAACLQTHLASWQESRYGKSNSYSRSKHSRKNKNSEK